MDVDDWSQQRSAFGLTQGGGSGGGGFSGHDGVKYYPYIREANSSSLSRLKETELNQEDEYQYAEADRQFKAEVERYAKSGQVVGAEAGDNATRAGDAARLVGTCTEMCPKYQRLKRVYTKDVDPFEIDGKGRFGPASAVKKFRRPAAGVEPDTPSTVRPPAILLSTLDYLVQSFADDPEVLRKAGSFLRDRTRSVRQDLAVQQTRCDTTLECFERIARLHILVIYRMSGVKDFDMHGELEQLGNTLKSLEDMYKDIHSKDDRGAISCEPEFQSYIVLTMLFDNMQNHRVSNLPKDVRDSYNVQFALRLHGLCQFKHYSPMAPNMFYDYIKAITDDTPGKRAPFLLCCLAYAKLGQVRKNGLRALRHNLRPQSKNNTVVHCASILGTTVEEFTSLAKTYRVEILGEGAEAYIHVPLRSDKGKDFNEDPTPPQPWEMPLHLEKMRPRSIMTNAPLSFSDMISASAEYRFDMNQVIEAAMNPGQLALEAIEPADIKNLRDLELPFDHSVARVRHANLSSTITVQGGPSSRFGANFFRRQKEQEIAAREQALDDFNSRPSPEELKSLQTNDVFPPPRPSVSFPSVSATPAQFGFSKPQQPTAPAFAQASFKGFQQQQPTAFQGFPQQQQQQQQPSPAFATPQPSVFQGVPPPSQSPFVAQNNQQPNAASRSVFGDSQFQQPASSQDSSWFPSLQQPPAPAQSKFEGFNFPQSATATQSVFGEPKPQFGDSTPRPAEAPSGSGEGFTTFKPTFNQPAFPSTTIANGSIGEAARPAFEHAFAPVDGQQPASIFAIPPSTNKQPPVSIFATPPSAAAKQPAASIFDKPVTANNDERTAFPSTSSNPFFAAPAQAASPLQSGDGIFKERLDATRAQNTALASVPPSIRIDDTAIEKQSEAHPDEKTEIPVPDLEKSETVEEETSSSEDEAAALEEERKALEEERKALEEEREAFNLSILNEGRLRRTGPPRPNGFKHRIRRWTPIYMPEMGAEVSVSMLQKHMKMNMIKLRVGDTLKRFALEKSSSNGQRRSGSVRILSLSSDSTDCSEEWYREAFGHVHQVFVSLESEDGAHPDSAAKRDIGALVFGCSAATTGSRPLSFEARLSSDMRSLKRQVLEVEDQLIDGAVSMVVIAYRVPGVEEGPQLKRLEAAVKSLNLPSSVVERRVVLLSDYKILKSLPQLVAQLAEHAAASAFPPPPPPTLRMSVTALAKPGKRQREEFGASLHLKKNRRLYADRTDLTYDWGRPAVHSGVRKVVPATKVIPVDKSLAAAKGFKLKASALEDLMLQLKTTFDAVDDVEP